MEWDKDFAYPTDKVKIIVHTFEMSEFAYKCILNFYDKTKMNASQVLFSLNEKIDSDDKEIEIEIPKDNLNFTYKDSYGFSKLCVELYVNDINFSYVGKETLDVMIDFGRE